MKYSTCFDKQSRMYYLVRPDGTRTIFGKRSVAEHVARECNMAASRRWPTETPERIDAAIRAHQSEIDRLHALLATKQLGITD